MKTSKAIKSRQYDPIEPFWISEDGFQMKFRSERDPGTVYTTIRDKDHPRRFRCDCPATGLCKHITRLVRSFAVPRYETFSIWTADEDAGKQRRRDVTLLANGREFYVTYGRRRLSLDNPDVKAVRVAGPWVSPVTEIVFDWKGEIVTVPGTGLLDEAARRGWTGGSRGRVRPGVGLV